jgi:hypothetical protein
VDPDAVDLDQPAAVAPDRPAPPRGDRRDAAAPRDELQLAVLERRFEHVDPDPAYEPQVLRRAPAGLLHVVDRDVLEEVRERVEPDAAAGVDVGEADPPAGAEGAAELRGGREASRTAGRQVKSSP